jgi:uncharacterized DUF497 family protein
MPLVFEWDAKKARTNRRKHGVSFDEACTVFDDPLAAIFADEDHSAGRTKRDHHRLFDPEAARAGMFHRTSGQSNPDFQRPAGHAAGEEKS